MKKNFRFYTWDLSTGYTRFYANVLWGNLGRRATIAKLDFYIAFWISIEVQTQDDRYKKILEENSDIVFLYMKNPERREWFLRPSA